MSSLIEKAKGLSLGGGSADRVTLRLANNSGRPVRITSWPSKIDNTHYELLPYRGSELDDTVPKAGSVFEDKTIELGSMSKPGRFKLTENWCWILFDVQKEDGSSIHLMTFVNSERSKILHAAVGVLDLDASHDAPTPAGEAGTAVIDGDVVTFTIGPDVLTLVNAGSDEARETVGTHKVVETSTYVSQPSSRITMRIGRDARYHEFSPPAVQHKVGDIKFSRHAVGGTTARFVGLFAQSIKDDSLLYEGHAELNPLTGAAHGKGLTSCRESTTVFTDEATISYGMSCQSLGYSDQLYCYSTPNHANWMGDLIAADSRWREVAFSRLALPAAHDAGMFVFPVNPSLLELIQSGSLGDAFGGKLVEGLAMPVVHGLIHALEHINLDPSRILLSIANVQKDDTKSMLRIGTRFFDFRPGYQFFDVIHERKGDICHVHAIVPGQLYIDFLADVLGFLLQHPSEIVVVELKSDGFAIQKNVVKDGKLVAISMVPDVEALADCLQQAQAKVAGSEAVKIGGAAELAKTLGSLIESGTRLIIIDRVHNPESWPRNDSYDHVAYNTQDPKTIIAALDKTYAAAQSGAPAAPSTIYQLQATPTSNVGSDVMKAFTWSDSSSLLVYMKPRQDRQTYPWIASHEFKEPGNIVFLNDFVDPALTELAIMQSWARSGL